jgi:hypothetical protein
MQYGTHFETSSHGLGMYKYGPSSKSTTEDLEILNPNPSVVNQTKCMSRCSKYNRWLIYALSVCLVFLGAILYSVFFHYQSGIYHNFLFKTNCTQVSSTQLNVSVISDFESSPTLPGPVITYDLSVVEPNENSLECYWNPCNSVGSFIHKGEITYCVTTTGGYTYYKSSPKPVYEHKFNDFLLPYLIWLVVLWTYVIVPAIICSGWLLWQFIKY